MMLTPAQRAAYFDRIGLAEPRLPDLDALAAIQRAHAFAFTWETGDAFLMRPEGGIEPDRAFAKLVTGRRGGWCYEMNGLLGAALAATGFAVTRLCAAVYREAMGEAAVGNHLTLRVDLEDGSWLVEAGLGNALPAPVPLRPGALRDGFMACAIEPADGDWLRYLNHQGVPPSFDFRADYADEAVLAAKEVWMRTDPGSPFTGNFVVMRHFPDRIESLVNRTRHTLTVHGSAARDITDPADFEKELGGTFDLELPDLAALWAKTGEVTARASEAA